MPTLSPKLISTLRKVSVPVAPPPLATAIETCDFCGNPIPPDHRHFVDLSNMRFLCTCEMCAVTEAESGVFKPLPQRTVYLRNFQLPESLWLEFMIPVNVAFFVFNAVRGGAVAYYPAPTGATESKLELDAWAQLKRLNPVLEDLAPDVEALLVNRLDMPPYEHFIVPIDICYKLIGLIKSSWTGIYGGIEAQDSTRHFFDELKKTPSHA